MNKFDFDRSLFSVGTVVEINYLTEPGNNIYAIREIEINEQASILWNKQGISFSGLEIRISIVLVRISEIEYFDVDVNVGWILSKDPRDTIVIRGQKFFVRSAQRMYNEYGLELIPVFSV